MQFKLSAFADEAGDSLKEQIDAMIDNGIDYLEIRSVDTINIKDISLEKAKEQKKMLDDAGIAVWSIGSPIGKVGINDNKFQEDYDALKHCLELAHLFDAKAIRLFSYFIPKDENPDIYRDTVLEHISKYVDIAKGSNVLLCHENEKGIYGDNAVRCLDIFKNVKGIYGVFDPANFVQCEQDTLKAWNMLAPYIKYMHIKDSLPDGNIVPAGQGAGKIPEIIKAYKKQGGEVLTLEPHLAVFSALASLEQEGNTSDVGGLNFPTQRAAFDAAVAALKEII